jgi:hypothetical protein
MQEISFEELKKIASDNKLRIISHDCGFSVYRDNSNGR